MDGFRTSTLAEQAYQMLRERILKGELPAGHRLLAEALGHQLSISPTPIKEALAMLQQDGLIEVEARRYSAVRRFNAREIDELYDARCMIEARAITVGLASGRLDAAFMARIDACAEQFAARASRRSRVDLRVALRHDHELHTVLVELAGNALIAEWHQRLLRQTQLVRAYSLRAYDAGRIAQARDEHLAIVEGLHARRPEVAVAALEAHLATSRLNIVLALQ